jgi:hypothetical protein
MCARTPAIFALISIFLLSSCEQKTETSGSSEATPHPVNESLDSALRRMEWGNIAFNAPRSMGYGETIVIHLGLDPTKSLSELESSIQEAGEKEGARVQIAPRMEAHLTGEGFDITPVTPESQPVSMEGRTDWKWDIRPKRFGSQSLHLSLNALLKIDGESSTRTIETFDKDISVNIVLPTSLIAYPQDHWEISAAVGGAILAFLGWFLGFRRKKGEG